MRFRTFNPKALISQSRGESLGRVIDLSRPPKADRKSDAGRLLMSQRNRPLAALATTALVALLLFAFSGCSDFVFRELMEGDPAVRAGVFQARLFPYRVALASERLLPDGG